MARKPNRACIDLVKEFEGFYPNAYRCPAGVLTVGYGHTKGVQQGQHVTLEEAEGLLESDLDRAGRDVEKLIRVPLTENQYAALVSFTFNVGGANLVSSTLRRKLNAGDYDAVPHEMSRWVMAKDPKSGEKRTLPGLVKRRAEEGLLWLRADGEDAGSVTFAMPQLVEKV